ncbi:MAG: hypothetical protein OXF74_11075 [Rhodobacteraceae bacterium]|nr:hypothetical protein [Paracoccaceae bacterium]
MVGHTEAFYEVLINVISPDLAKKLYPQPWIKFTGADVQILGIGGQAHLRSLPDLSSRYAEFWQALVVVAIDEAQNIGMTYAGTTAAILQGVHDNINNLPVVPVLPACPSGSPGYGWRDTDDCGRRWAGCGVQETTSCSNSAMRRIIISGSRSENGR